MWIYKIFKTGIFVCNVHGAVDWLQLSHNKQLFERAGEVPRINILFIFEEWHPQEGCMR